LFDGTEQLFRRRTRLVRSESAMIANDASTRTPGVSKLREIGFLSARKGGDTKSGESIVPQELAIFISRTNQCVDGPF